MEYERMTMAELVAACVMSVAVLVWVAVLIVTGR
jgi:hypothetical protein